jgi:subtilisin family serine protease
MRLSGTSMAAALASGAAALLFEQRPELTAQEVKAILQATSTPTVDGPLVGGAGSLNVLAAATFVAASGDGRQ